MFHLFRSLPRRCAAVLCAAAALATTLRAQVHYSALREGFTNDPEMSAPLPLIRLRTEAADLARSRGQDASLDQAQRRFLASVVHEYETGFVAGVPPHESGFARLLAENPESDEARLGLGLTSAHAGDHAGAMFILEKCGDVSPGLRAIALRASAGCYLQLERSFNFENYLRGLAAAMPGRSEIDLLRARYCQRMGKGHDALEIYEATGGLRMLSPGDVLERQAHVWISMGLPKRGGKLLDEAVAAGHRGPGLDWLRGRQFLRMQMPREALAEVMKALANRPEHPVYHHDVGLLLLGEKRIDEALVHLNRAIQLDRGFAAPYFTRAVLGFATGSYGTAQRDLESFLGLSVGVNYIPSQWTSNAVVDQVAEAEGLRHLLRSSEALAAKDHQGAANHAEAAAAVTYRTGLREAVEPILRQNLDRIRALRRSAQASAATVSGEPEEDRFIVLKLIAAAYVFAIVQDLAAPKRSPSAAPPPLELHDPSPEILAQWAQADEDQRRAEQERQRQLRDEQDRENQRRQYEESMRRYQQSLRR